MKFTVVIGYDQYSLHTYQIESIYLIKFSGSANVRDAIQMVVQHPYLIKIQKTNKNYKVIYGAFQTSNILRRGIKIDYLWGNVS